MQTCSRRESDTFRASRVPVSAPAASPRPNCLPTHGLATARPSRRTERKEVTEHAVPSAEQAVARARWVISAGAPRCARAVARRGGALLHHHNHRGNGAPAHMLLNWLNSVFKHMGSSMSAVGCVPMHITLSCRLESGLVWPTPLCNVARLDSGLCCQSWSLRHADLAARHMQAS